MPEGRFLVRRPGIEIDLAFTRKLGAGLFGGEGFILQRLTGGGLAFVYAGGTIIKKRTGPRRMSAGGHGLSGCLCSAGDYDIQFIGGFKNALFGGEGIFLARLTGPGLVYLQSLPFSRQADRIMAAARFQQKGEQPGVTGLGGGILGGILGGERNF